MIVDRSKLCIDCYIMTNSICRSIIALKKMRFSRRRRGYSVISVKSKFVRQTVIGFTTANTFHIQAANQSTALDQVTNQDIILE